MSVDLKSAGDRWWVYAGVLALIFHLWLAVSFSRLTSVLLSEKAELFLASLTSSTEQTLQASHYLEEGIVASLRQIADQVASAPAGLVSNEWLEALRQKHDLKAISIYDRFGKVRVAHDPALIGSDLPPDYGCHDIIEGSKTEHVFGFSSGVFCETDAFGIARKMPDGGALRLLTGVDFVLGFEKNVGLVPLIKRFREYPGVARLDLVDENGRSLLGDAAAGNAVGGVVTSREFLLRGVPLGRFEVSLNDPAVENLRDTGFIAIFASCFFSLVGLKLLQGRLKRQSELLEEKRHAEDTRRRIEGFGRVVAAVAHEVRNPLNAMNLTVSAMRADFAEGCQNEKLEKRFELLEQTIRQADQMIRDLMQAGRPIVVHKRAIPIKSWLQTIVDAFQMHTGNARIEIAADESASLMLDPDQMRQVVWNLMLNAVQAGATKIGLSAKTDVSGGYLTVSNNGPQISEETLAGLFVPGNTTRADGFGLGLYNCQRICIAHGGRIMVNSAVAETAFEIFLPLESES